MRSKQASRLLEQVREQKPLVHNITNTVVANFTANGLLAMGASPVMANAEQEADEMAKQADALVLNLGTLNDAQIEAMAKAGRAANEKGIPVVLDPVGAGATIYRTNAAHKLLNELKITLVRGNAAEISAIAGLDSDIRGVDASRGEYNVESIAVYAAKNVQASAIAVTGERDAVADKHDVYTIYNGNSMLSKVTGTGCLASSVIAAFLSVSDKLTEGAASALGYYGIAAQKASAYTNGQGPGTFQIQLLNALYRIDEIDFKQQLHIEREIVNRGGALHE
ncbi:hydroxyethylthiazole kinase [Alteribacillus persepolensis]|uniref:Hydroxyethylthiazole kinase n=1 Tax=Alteribacillus persepolensis TaxID=568899 RepID=A0A1G8FK24_9BACI|nr:hydroxyethylthiazole kinase [Alteribacillus persepolensis]SDH82399.1 hydroxyethylthiazole kinase [Alteribacillus persepolensis]